MVALRRFENNAAQIASEFAAFVELLKREKVTSYLEIGSQYGGALWEAATEFPVGSRIVSVDLPWGDKSTQPHLEACVSELNRMGYDTNLYLGDSNDPGIVDQVSDLGPFDCVFIDGNHTLPYVTKDWQNYGPMAKMVAFHDIVWDRPVRSGRLPIEVSKLWREIKNDYRHVEFIAEGSEKGIGVLWR